MRILLFSPSSTPMITTYVGMLVENLPSASNTEVAVASSLTAFRKTLGTFSPDIVHLHGAWKYSIGAAALLSLRHQVRYVYSPHGQLEPWVIHTRYWKEKLPQLLVYQRWVVSHAYATICNGTMERLALEKLGWTPRIEVVYNPLVTSSIQPTEACLQLSAIYQKVLDSDTLALMSATTRQALVSLIKAGTAGDRRWVDSEGQAACHQLGTSEWRQLMIYAWHEHIYEEVKSGAETLRLNPPQLTPASYPCYVPTRREPRYHRQELLPPPSPANNKAMTVYVRNLVRQAEKGQLTLRQVVDFSHTVRQASLEEDKLAEDLKDTQLYKPLGGLLQAAGTLTALDQGLMPIAPCKNRLSKKIIRTIKHHLAI